MATDKSSLPFLDNYIYISHLDDGIKYWRLPVYPDEVTDNMSSTFRENNALGRSAPVMTYSNSGPRTVSFNFDLHRDMMDDVNENYSNSLLQGEGEDYIENLIHALQAIAVPKYNLANKYVEPPMVAIRLGDEIFIKGVVSQAIQVSYKKPILSNNKYAMVSLGLTITEVDPYDATTIYSNGSFRGVVQTLKSGMGFEEEN